MSSNTPNLGLLKKDPMVDGNETFNIETMLNENWDKVDEAVGNIKVPDASLTEKGIVQLSNATNGTRENVAATEKAIKDAALQAKSYTDQQISLVTETGIPKLVSYPLLVTATADNQKVFEIPLDLFDANTDTLLVAINRAVLDSTQYTVTNTVRNEAGEVTQRAKITLLSGVASTSEVTMIVLKNVPIGPEGAINGAVLAVNSVPINRVNGLQDQLDETFQAGNERKAEVVAALVAIGITASTNETWAQLISKISAVIRATGNAMPGNVLVGKTFSNATGNNLVGTYVPPRVTQYPSFSKSAYSSEQMKVCDINSNKTLISMIERSSVRVQSGNASGAWSQVSLALINSAGRVVLLPNTTTKVDSFGSTATSASRQVGDILFDLPNRRITYNSLYGDNSLNTYSVVIPTNYDLSGSYFGIVTSVNNVTGAALGEARFDSGGMIVANY